MKNKEFIIKKTFEAPKAEIIIFNMKDIITVSGGFEGLEDNLEEIIEEIVEEES